MTYGYSRDHRADLKQWMLALATMRQRDVPLYLKTLDGNANVLRLQPLHQQVLALLGPPYEEFYQSAK